MKRIRERPLLNPRFHVHYSVETDICNGVSFGGVKRIALIDDKLLSLFNYKNFDFQLIT